LSQRRLCLIEALTHLIDPARDVAFGGICLLIRSAAHQGFRISHCVAQPVVSNRTCGFRHLARSRPLLAAGVASGLIEIGFELAKLRLLESRTFGDIVYLRYAAA